MEDLSGITLLLVDDDPMNIYAISAALERYKCELIIASNGIEAINLLESNPGINLVLMDIMMPEMDGFEAMRIIRSKDQYRQLPIIALTAKAMKGDDKQCLEAGASDYLSKPIDIRELAGKMQALLSKPGM